MKKRLDLTIEKCVYCPYFRENEKGNLACKAIATSRPIYLSDLAMPNWCPLPNAPAPKEE